MPVKPGTDTKGSFFRWGKSGKKYYYAKDDKASTARARAKAAAQGRAAFAAGYKGNSMLQRIKVNFTGNIRHDSMEDRKYLVAPMIMLVEGVHDGSNGPLLYLEEDMMKTPQIWNHKPVVVYHPSKDGQGVSACDPNILTTRGIGVIMNTSLGEVTIKDADGKDVKRPALHAEAWLEEDRMNKVDERIAEAVEKNQMMELSTGLYTDNDSAEENAEWNGEKYDAIARNYRPDHLALLPDLTGACSIEDGAGFLRLNAKPDKINIIGNEMSHSNIRSLLNSWLQEVKGTEDKYIYVEAVYDDFFVYEDDAKYYKYNYSLENSQITITGDAEEVIRITEWRTLSGEFVGNKEDKSNSSNENNDSKRKEQVMDEKKKVKIIDALIACNTNSWGKDDRETLEAMKDATLEKLLEGTIAAEKAVENAVKKGDAAVLVANQEKEKAEAKTKEADAESVSGDSSDGKTSGTDGDAKGDEKPQTTNEYIAGAPKEIREVLESGMRSHNAIKASLIKRITANEKNQFTDDELKVKDLPELRKLVAILPGVEKVAGSDLEVNNFEGLEDVEDITQNTEEPMLMPAVVGGEIKK